MVAPGGGSEDKFPPRVSGTSLAPNSVKQGTTLDITLQFDEWIVQKPPSGAVAISPPIVGKLRVKVDGDKMRIYTDEPLDSNTTYTLTITNAVKDLRNNPLEKSFQILFSTGDFLDSLKADFSVYLQDSLIKKKKFPVVAFYPVGAVRAHKNYLRKFRDSTITAEVDTTPNITKEIPQYIAQTDSLGNGTLRGMQAGEYLALAFLDENNNQKLETDLEIAGVAKYPVVIDGGDLQLNFSLGDLDTSSISLDATSQRGNSEIELSFSRNVLFDSLLNCSFATARDTIFPTDFYLEDLSKNPVLVVQGLQNDTLYNVVCRAVIDSLGRQLSQTLNSTKFRFKKIEEKSIVPTAISRIEPSKIAADVLPNSPIKISYNHPISADTIIPKLRLYVNKDSAKFEVKQTDATHLEIPPIWSAGSRIKFVQVVQDSVVDTLFQEKLLTQFNTVSKLKLASLKGDIPGGDVQTIIVLQETTIRKTAKSSIRSLGKIFTAKCDENGHFEINGLAEGTYKFYYFKDLNDDGKLTSGSLFPLRAGEPFFAPSEDLILPHGDDNFLKELFKDLGSL
ncbi:hypothetical protein AGMMS49938_16420 [Fibrobacterales bacterium]|nr:hypothetical protein AGMMS49938_16420 [Fibrobacterales bacterium]